MLTLLATRFSFWLSFSGIAAAVFLLVKTNTPEGIPDPLQAPPEKPDNTKLAGSGIVESFGDNTRISANAPGIVRDIFVLVGDEVNKGDELFVLDESLAQSELAIAQTGKDVAIAELESLKKIVDRLSAVGDSRAVSKADLEARKSEVAVAEALIKNAEAKVDQASTRLDLLTVKSPRDGTILQVNTRPGEFASPGIIPPPVLLGNSQDLQIRVDVDEELAGEVPEQPRAVGYVRGVGEKGIDLDFVRIEPLVVPKRNISGLPAERTDTRVLQVIFKPKQTSDSEKLYIGQQLDVFIFKSPDG